MIRCDAPMAWGLYFQDSASPQMERLIELHNIIMFYLVIVLFVVSWMLLSIMLNYTKEKIINKDPKFERLIEIIWPITPGLILILIAFPPFKILDLIDEIPDPIFNLYSEGHQWYWSYKYPDHVNKQGEFIEYDSYLVPDSDLVNGIHCMDGGGGGGDTAPPAPPAPQPNPAGGDDPSRDRGYTDGDRTPQGDLIYNSIERSYPHPRDLVSPDLVFVNRRVVNYPFIGEITINRFRATDREYSMLEVYGDKFSIHFDVMRNGSVRPIPGIWSKGGPLSRWELNGLFTFFRDDLRLRTCPRAIARDPDLRHIHGDNWDARTVAGVLHQLRPFR